MKGRLKESMGKWNKWRENKKKCGTRIKKRRGKRKI